MQLIWDFIQEQHLGMKWLNVLIGRLLSAAGLDLGSHMGGQVFSFSFTML